MDPKELLSTCKPAFEELMGKFGNRGASPGILKDGKVDYLGLGKETTVPNEHTLYLISSMTKPILAVAVGILVSSGAFQLDTPVEKIVRLHAICNHRNGAPLRVVDLLDHRSEFFSFRGARNYNNLCYAILAMVIEKTTGISWAEFIHAEIFDPLGMARSTADMSRRKPDGNIADSYCAQIEGWEHNDNVDGDDDAAAVYRRYLPRVRGSNPVAVAQSVQPSRCSDTNDTDTIGAAAGIMSTVSDQLKFDHKYITLSINRPNTELTKLEAGFIVVLDHIDACVQDPTCAYAGGWNPINLPWDQSQRAHCADGENYGRLQGVAGLGIAELRDKRTPGRSSKEILAEVNIWRGTTAATWSGLLHASSSSLTWA
ncbi:beta-lactamase/transpeptidase-like protein [Coniochaeta sp. 2T2.1]|nr:beta-lactamase/transpeptidase-like protein [Coniochaeta sp. 2T2.1]